MNEFDINQLFTIKHGMPWILSAITVYMSILVGNQNKNAWVIGLGNQCLWLLWIVVDQAWGLVPMNLILSVTYFRNHIKWNKQQ